MEAATALSQKMLPWERELGTHPATCSHLDPDAKPCPPWMFLMLVDSWPGMEEDRAQHAAPRSSVYTLCCSCTLCAAAPGHGQATECLRLHKDNQLAVT